MFCLAWKQFIIFLNDTLNAETAVVEKIIIQFIDAVFALALGQMIWKRLFATNSGDSSDFCHFEVYVTSSKKYLCKPLKSQFFITLFVPFSDFSLQ